jgi:hypothetical protein
MTVSSRPPGPRPFTAGPHPTPPSRPATTTTAPHATTTAPHATTAAADATTANATTTTTTPAAWSVGGGAGRAAGPLPAVASGGGAPSWVGLQASATTPWRLRPARTPGFVAVDARAFVPPTPAAAGSPEPVVALPAGTRVQARIHGADVAGVIVGFDAKGRAVLDAGGFERTCAHADLVVVGGPAPRRSVLASLPAGAVVTPPVALGQALDAALDLKVNGSHTAREYVEAFRARGFEVLVVGGGVRDALRMHATTPNASQQQLLSTLQDIDIVTTAPPPVARAICEAIAPELADGGVWSPRFVEQFGVVLAGGKKAGQKDSEGLDICAMKRGGSTREMAVNPDTGERAFPTSFGDDLRRDALGRDFCCNALYYDPAHGVVVDPTLQGIADAEQALLHPVQLPTAAAPGDPSLSARFWKFRLRGFSADGETTAALRHNAQATFATSSGKQRWTLQNVLGRTAPKDAADRASVEAWLAQLRRVMRDDRCGDLFDRAVRGGVREGVIAEVLKRTTKGQPPPPAATTTTTTPATMTTTTGGAP